MRSHDIVYGWPFNMRYFVVLMYRMLDELSMPDLNIGNLYYNATSLHMYEAHLDKATAMVYGDKSE
jgi:thymidylate synthase